MSDGYSDDEMGRVLDRVVESTDIAIGSLEEEIQQLKSQLALANLVIDAKSEETEKLRAQRHRHRKALRELNRSMQAKLGQLLGASAHNKDLALQLEALRQKNKSLALEVVEWRDRFDLEKVRCEATDKYGNLCLYAAGHKCDHLFEQEWFPAVEPAQVEPK
jgi:chromosome segregation ATPase